MAKHEQRRPREAEDQVDAQLGALCPQEGHGRRSVSPHLALRDGHALREVNEAAVVHLVILITLEIVSSPSRIIPNFLRSAHLVVPNVLDLKPRTLTLVEWRSVLLFSTAFLLFSALINE